MVENRSNSVVELEQVTFTWPGNQTPTLDIKQLHITKGEHLFIKGPSGCGKSTLLGLLTGINTTSSGQLRVLGQDLNQMKGSQRDKFRADHIGYIFQQFNLLPELTALNNVALPLKLRGDKHAITKAMAWLEKVGLAHRKNHKPGELSGGEQQGVAIARALVFEPNFIFADEPTGNLDQKSATEIADILFACCQENNAGLVVVTHSNVLASRAQHTFLLANGSLADGQIRQESNEALKVVSC